MLSKITEWHYNSLIHIDELLFQHHKSFTESQVVNDKILWVFFDDCIENGSKYVQPYNGACRANGMVFIHRAKIEKPNTSHIHELSFILHEVGHSLLLDKKKKLSRTGFSYQMRWEEQLSQTRLEELLAWLVGMRVACKLPIPWWYLSILLLVMVSDMFYFWTGYLIRSLDY